MKKILALAFTGALMLACSTGAFAQDKTKKVKTIKEKEVKETPTTHQGTATPQESKETKTKGTRTRAISIDEEGVSEGDKKDNGGGLQSQAIEVKAVTRETRQAKAAPRR